MAYVAYATEDYYFDVFEGDVLDNNVAEKSLYTASRHIDSLTFNRIVGRGISNLTPFQQDIIREVCCELAEFEYENEDLIKSVLQSYSINGVSMSFGNSWNVKVVSGVAIRSDIYEKLTQTGLCCVTLGGR